MTGDLKQQTRSGSTFTCWTGPSVLSSNPSYSLAQALSEAGAVDLEQCYESPAPVPESVFSSPLSGSLTPIPQSPPVSPPTLGQRAFANALIERLAPLTKPSPPPDAEANKRRRLDKGTDGRPLTEAQARRKANKKKKAHTNDRAKQAAKKKDSNHVSHRMTRPAIEKKYVTPAQNLKIDVSTADIKKNSASGSYIGTNDNGERSKAQPPLEKLVGENSRYKFTYVPWNGRDPTPIVSADGYLLGILAGNPDPRDWPRLQKEAADALEDARHRCQVNAEDRRHRRGNFTTLRAGVSHGGGPKKPSNASNNKTNAAILEELNKMEVFIRISGFTDSVMATWAPSLHSHYDDCLAAVYKNDSNLKPIFPSSIFASTTYNLGPRTVCHKHRDFGNLTYGWCGVTAFGSYDHTKGGHLILWDLKLVIEFPPGATILIPSAIVAHSNVPIAKHETRYSFTQYTAGGLFRWVDNNFQTADVYQASLEEDEKVAHEDALKGRWAYALSLIPRRT